MRIIIVRTNTSIIMKVCHFLSVATTFILVLFWTGYCHSFASSSSSPFFTAVSFTKKTNIVPQHHRHRHQYDGVLWNDMRGGAAAASDDDDASKSSGSTSKKKTPPPLAPVATTNTPAVGKNLNSSSTPTSSSSSKTGGGGGGGSKNTKKSTSSSSSSSTTVTATKPKSAKAMTAAMNRSSSSSSSSSSSTSSSTTEVSATVAVSSNSTTATAATAPTSAKAKSAKQQEILQPQTPLQVVARVVAPQQSSSPKIDQQVTTATNTTLVQQQQQREPQILRYNASNAIANANNNHPGNMFMKDLLDVLETSPATGLTLQQAQDRLLQYGRNELTRPPSKTIWQLIREQFQDSLVQILLIVAILSAIFSIAEVWSTSPNGEEIWKSFVEPAVILAILILNAFVGIWQSQTAADSLQALQAMQSPTANVIRNGGISMSIPAADVVPGDVLEIRVGDKIPADARVLAPLASSTLQVDEGSLTGESVTVSKLPGDEGRCHNPNNNNAAMMMIAPIQDQRGMLYSGTVVTSGMGRAVVTQTGMDTEFGKIQKGVTEAKSEETKTPLSMKLDEFGETLTVIIGVICLAVWIVSIPKMNDPSFPSVWQGAIYYAKVAVALGVAAIPEGLPAVITLCLSLGTRRMAERNVLVRKLQSVETLGCTSVICTDKTGTLTTNEMTAVSLVLLEHDDNDDNYNNANINIKDSNARIVEHQIEGYSYSPIGKVNGIPSNIEVKEQPLGSVADVAAVSALCNNAKIVGHDHDDVTAIDAAATTVTDNTDKRKKKKKGKDDKKERKSYERVGEPTEAALCVLAEKLGGMSHYLDDDNDNALVSSSAARHLDREGGLHIHVPPSVLANANVKSWRSAHERIAMLEFHRDRKSMSVLCRFPQGDYPTTANAIHAGTQGRPAGNRLLVKGAPNLLLERCTRVKFRDGTVAKLTGPLRRALEEKISEMAARPLRCLALAVKEGSQLEESLQTLTDKDSSLAQHPLLSNADNYKNIESGLTLVGIVGIKDPARPEVAKSIDLCTKAGIRVMMITGDARDTAIAIARDVHIFPPARVTTGGGGDGVDTNNNENLKAFEGREFFNKPEHEQLQILKEGNIVFCRAEPADKQKLVKMLQSLKEIPAMTGDGVNDAPALQQAAIGIAMGITGTEVSKEAADMILADDNFSTIVVAVEEGRRIYANMQAFICFLISCNIGEIFAIFFATLAGFPEPLTAMHLLWVNLVTDGPSATALGFNPPAPDIMEQPPRPSDEPIMTRWLLTRYCLTGLYVGLATIGVFAGHYMDQGVSLSQLASWSQCGVFWSPATEGVMCSDLFQGSGRMLPQTLSLTTLVCMEMLKALSAVSVDSSLLRVGPQSNPWLLLGVSGPLLLHLFVVYSSKLGLPAIGESFGVVPLSMDDWATVLQWAIPILLVDEILKAIGRWIHREDRIKSANDAAAKKNTASVSV